MLALTKYNSKELLSFNNSTELKEMLKFCNPTLLRYYKAQIQKLDLGIKIEEMGNNITIKRITDVKRDKI